MGTQLQKESKIPIGGAFRPVPTALLQRKCACGSHTMAGGECEECTKKKGMLQRKLVIGASHDPLEQEADRVAEQVMAAPLNSTLMAIPPRIQRFTGQAREDLNTAPASVESVLASSGKPLEPALRQDMEVRFGHNFSQVRVHTGSAAEQSARDVNSLAYTVGRDVVFGMGNYAPGTLEGRKLIAHELTHTIQQDSEPTTQSTQIKSSLSPGTKRLTGKFLQRRDGPSATVRSPVFEETVTQVSDVAGGIVGRSLTRRELTLARSIFGDSLQYQRIRLVTAPLLEYRTVGNNIYIPNNFSISDEYMAQTLIHELTHVWQYQHRGTSYISESLGAQIAATITHGARNFAYDYRIQSNQTFFSFSAEQQGSIVENYFAMLRDQSAIPTDQAAGRVRTYHSNHLGADGFQVALSAADRLSEIARELPLHVPLIQQMQSSLPRTDVELLRIRAIDVMRTPGEEVFSVPEERRLAPIRPIFQVNF